MRKLTEEQKANMEKITINDDLGRIQINVSWYDRPLVYAYNTHRFTAEEMAIYYIKHWQLKNPQINIIRK